MSNIHTPMPQGDLAQLSVLSLAHVGDGVYELLVRTHLARSGALKVAQQHKQTVAYVSAPAQARFIEAIMDALTPEETAVYKRGRNARVNSVPSGCTVSQYHAATGLETLFGWLWLSGQPARCERLFDLILEVHDGT